MFFYHLRRTPVKAAGAGGTLAISRAAGA